MTTIKISAKTLELLVKQVAELTKEVAALREMLTGVTISPTEFEEWCGSPSKDGLKVPELRAKAKELGMKVNAKTKKPEIIAYLKEKVVLTHISESQYKKVFARPANGGMEISVLRKLATKYGMEVTGKTKKQVKDYLRIFARPNKGGLKLAALKTMAKQFGMEVTGKTTKTEIKKYMKDKVVKKYKVVYTTIYDSDSE